VSILTPAEIKANGFDGAASDLFGRRTWGSIRGLLGLAKGHGFSTTGGRELANGRPSLRAFQENVESDFSVIGNCG